MKYKDLSDGSLFQYSPQPGTHETAFKAQGTAYLLRTGEIVLIHANRNVDDIPRPTGDGYRLGTTRDGRLTIFSQATDTQIFCHDFLIIGHAMIPKDAVRPIVGKVELKEQRELVDIILARLEQAATHQADLLRVLKSGLFEDFAQIKLT